MKTACLLFGLLVSLPCVVTAQPAPDRSADVERFIQANVHRFNGTDDRRREVLFDLIRVLNVQDNGNWGALQKMDQGNKIPADIIVWRSTREHFDVLTDTGGLWRVVGPLTNAHWIWLQVEGPTPAPPVPPPPPPNLEPLFTALESLQAQIKALQVLLAVLDARLSNDEVFIEQLETSFMQHKKNDPHFTDCQIALPAWLRLGIGCDLK